MRYISKHLLLFLLVVAGVSACVPGSSPLSTPLIIRQCLIEKVEIAILESFPVQVHVKIQGILDSGCTTLHHITQQQKGNIFFIKVTTQRPADILCADVIFLFEENVALDVYGLPAGTYIVDVNGVRDSFTLDVDNVLP
jgi:inhibitor of cysteine peptidase